MTSQTSARYHATDSSPSSSALTLIRDHTLLLHSPLGLREPITLSIVQRTLN